MLWIFNICFVSFFFLLVSSGVLIGCGVLFVMKDLVYFVEWELFTINSSLVVMTFLFDWMSLFFLGFVMFISSMVIFYSSVYMAHDEYVNRFILLVLLFVLSMGALIVSPNLISILLGWDGLGLVSYCLVIYYQNIKSYNAGMLTALSNRVGDVAILLAITWMFNFGSWNYVYYVDCMVDVVSMKLICGLVILAGMTKSAQIPFSAWLPAAMAAPTPVSALVHSSTLVTAGVYLLIRFSPVLQESRLWVFLLFFSAMTMAMAGISASHEFDLKKIIALSTLSQLGLMMSILSFGYPIMAFFHLLSHAMFKALLFLCAGAIIHNSSDWQDIRSFGAMGVVKPLTGVCFNIANLSLCGIPFLAGFYSKDLILEMFMLGFLNIFLCGVIFVSTGLTVFYSFRLLYYSMSGLFKAQSCGGYSEDEEVMLWSMIFLTLMAVSVGCLLEWSLFSSFEVVILPWYMKISVLFTCGSGAYLGYLVGMLDISILPIGLVSHFSHFFGGSMWFLPYVSTYGGSVSPLVLGNFYLKGMDQGWSEFFGGQGIYDITQNGAKILQLLQDNNVKLYLMTFVVWVVLVLVITLI
uniref:NADH-ubiquinone oxidoreductase chain 5 n=1 Tax=Nesomachilis australica TaxID=299218 RepID=Q5C846_9INSE|nr:NADH dehydrogenase subunit 5 [Nesomachilis australica]AAV50270.1 NADH dehydrogenase subunit 5 [Nesomachilis australica]